MNMTKRDSTKQKIWNAFYDLCQTMPFKKITVEKIIEQSGISKATFYRHFKDKYDVLNYNSTAIAEHIIGERPCKNWRDFLGYMFEEIEKEKEYYRKAFLTSGQNAHFDFLLEYSMYIVRGNYMLYNGYDEISTEDEYTIAHYCNGCVASIEMWLNESSPMTVSQMADLFYDIMPERLREAWVSM